MMKFVQLVSEVVVFLGVVSLPLAQGDVLPASCKKLSACSCRLDDGRTIDLSPMGSSSGPRFRDVTVNQPTGEYKYSYDPCVPFTVRGGGFSDYCIGVASCQMDQFGNGYSLGKHQSVKFKVKKTTLEDKRLTTRKQDFSIQLEYTKQSDNQDFQTRITQVNLICADKERFIATGDVSLGYTYVYRLESPHACASSLGTSGLSPGGIFCIILVVCVAVYLIGGILFLKLARGASGAEVIPNKDLWMALPGLSKDGCQLIYSKVRCQGESNSTKTYDQI